MQMFVSGPTGAGKSTLIDTLEEFLKSHDIIPTVYPYVDQMAPLIMRKDILGLQKYIYHRMAAEHQVLSKYPGYQLTDRCPVDWMCYTRTYISVGIIKHLDVVGLLQDFDETFDLDLDSNIKVIYLRPNIDFCRQVMLNREEWEVAPWANAETLKELFDEYDLQWQFYKQRGADVRIIKDTNIDKRLKKSQKIILEWLGGK